MIEKVLIANRGEIALRVIRTCKALGIKTVAVYSDEDRNSMHVKQASEAYHIGEAAPSKSYLNQEKILEIMLSSGTDAVHPGYGFLSENDDFARLCEKNKINFIGPSADSMNLCGDKMRCKDAMLKAKVPTVPGSPGLVKDADDAEKIANDIGYPVMLKSVYGGGGRGIRIVTNDKELRDGFESVTGESIAAVGKSAILVEKFLEKTRHIEYQMARDKHGNTVHIFERECSIQRRNQKLIEQWYPHTKQTKVWKLHHLHSHAKRKMMIDWAKNFKLEISFQIGHPGQIEITGSSIMIEKFSDRFDCLYWNKKPKIVCSFK